MVEPGETCDDGNTDNRDGCSSGCVIDCVYVDEAGPSVPTDPIGTHTCRCGDGIINGDEECDGSDPKQGIYCSDRCELETIVLPEDPTDG